MIKSVCIFEDSKVSQLYPLALTRPVYDLRCGISSVKDKLFRYFPLASISLFCRDYLAEIVRQQNPDVNVNECQAENCLFFNGRVLVNAELLNEFNDSCECIYLQGDDVIAAYLKNGNIQKVQLNGLPDFDHPGFHKIAKKEVSARIISYPWDLVNANADEITSDFRLLSNGSALFGQIHQSVVLLNNQQIYIGENSIIKPGVVLDAGNGPIYIGKNATILPNAVIEGPAFIGDNSTIKIGAKIYEGTSIGEMCKVGGEVEESIIHSFSNKQHDGFLGHAYLGQWVNLGADTNNSDLKNNYGSVKVQINGQKVDSGSQFVGLFMGDHSKTGINTMFNTGTVTGVMCNIFGSTFPPVFLPSFSWGGSEGLQEYQIEKALTTARVVMARRNMPMSESYGKLLRAVFDLTQHERD